MPVLVNCPGCRVRCAIPEFALGEHVLCGSCQLVFLAAPVSEASNAPPPASPPSLISRERTPPRPTWQPRRQEPVVLEEASPEEMRAHARDLSTPRRASRPVVWLALSAVAGMLLLGVLGVVAALWLEESPQPTVAQSVPRTAPVDANIAPENREPAAPTAPAIQPAPRADREPPRLPPRDPPADPVVRPEPMPEKVEAKPPPVTRREIMLRAEESPAEPPRISRPILVEESPGPARTSRPILAEESPREPTPTVVRPMPAPPPGLPPLPRNMTLVQAAEMVLPFEGRVNTVRAVLTAKERVAVLSRPPQSKDFQLDVFDVTGRTRIARLHVPDPHATPLVFDFSCDGRYFALEYTIGKLSIWSVAEQRPVVSDWLGPPTGRVSRKRVALSLLDGDRVLMISVTGMVQTYSLPNMNLAWEAPPPEKGEIWALAGRSGIALSGDRKQLAQFTGTAFRVLDTQTGAILKTTADHGRPGRWVQCRGVAFSPSGDVLAAALEESGVKDLLLARFDLKTGELRGTSTLRPTGRYLLDTSASLVWPEERALLLVPSRKGCYLIDTETWRAGKEMQLDFAWFLGAQTGEPHVWYAAQLSAETASLVGLRFPADQQGGSYRLGAWGLMR
jgi:hypothetical protein